MRSTRAFVLALSTAVAALATPAAADVTVVGKYAFANGDTATRVSYYSRKRARTTAPNGMEFIYDTQLGRVSVIDHASELSPDEAPSYTPVSALAATGFIVAVLGAITMGGMWLAGRYTGKPVFIWGLLILPHRLRFIRSSPSRQN